MKVSRKLIDSTVIVYKYFASMNGLYQYFIENPAELMAGLYCAVGGNPYSTDYSLAVWELELYDGSNWIAVTPNSNYALTITDDGIRALTDAVHGCYKLSLNRVKILSDDIRNSIKPLIYWTDEDFLEGHTLELDFKSTDSDWNKHISYNENLTNGGLQIGLKILPTDLNLANSPSYYIQTIGLYVVDQRIGSNEAPVLFGIASLPAGIYKTTDLLGTGNEIKFYINTVLDNLGNVLDLSVIQSDCNSVAEVNFEGDLPSNLIATNDPYNLYLINNFNGTGTPALAAKQLNSDNSITWRYFSPSENSLEVPNDSFDSSVSNYMFVYFNPETQKYEPAVGDWEGETNKAAMGVRVGNAIVYAGSVTNLAAEYAYQYSFNLVAAGVGYSEGDVLTAPGTPFLLRVTSVNSIGSISQFMVTPKFGAIEYSGERDLEYKQYATAQHGDGATLAISSEPYPNYDWNVDGQSLANFINKPLYVGTGERAGKLTATKTDSFVGWCINSKTIRLGLDARTEATESDYGIVRYASDGEIKSATNSSTVVNPVGLANHYLRKTYISGKVGDSSSNPIEVDTHTKFTKTIVGTGTDVDGVSFKGTAYRAEWGDLAEFYKADKFYPSGTLITIGSGPAEITVAVKECNGIISEKPGLQIGEKSGENDLPVALVGKVPVLFDNQCALHFGDKIYLSKLVPGHASTKENGKCLGKIIEQNPNGKVKVMCSVRIEF